MAPPLMKQFQRLLRNVDSFSDHQVEVLLDGVNFDAPLETFNIRIRPNDGPYRGGTFEFSICPQLGGRPPEIVCETTVYHPNIDPDDHGVCFNLLSDLWTEDLTLEDVVQGLLFLFYHPCIDDPLSYLFCGTESQEEFEENVRMSLRGETVCDFDFEWNLIEEPVVEEEEKVTERRKSYGGAVCESGARLRRSLSVGDRPHNDAPVRPAQRDNTAYHRMVSRGSDASMYDDDHDDTDSDCDTDVRPAMRRLASLVRSTSYEPRDLSVSHTCNDSLSIHSYERAACGCRFGAGSVTQRGTSVDVCEGQGHECHAEDGSSIHGRTLKLRVTNFFSSLFGRAGR